MYVCINIWKGNNSKNIHVIFENLELREPMCRFLGAAFKIWHLKSFIHV